MLLMYLQFSKHAGFRDGRAPEDRLVIKDRFHTSSSDRYVQDDRDRGVYLSSARIVFFFHAVAVISIYIWFD